MSQNSILELEFKTDTGLETVQISVLLYFEQIKLWNMNLLIY